MMDFIMNNYIWFIIGGILIVLAIIGFLAEKLKFGKKEFSLDSKKSEPQKMKKQKSEPERTVEAVVEDNPEDRSIEDVLAVPEREIKEENTTGEMFAYTEPDFKKEAEGTAVETKEVNNDLPNDDLFAPLNAPVEEKASYEEPVMEEEPVIEKEEVDNKSEISASDVPDLDEVRDSVLTFDDDVWKFQESFGFFFLLKQIFKN